MRMRLSTPLFSILWFTGTHFISCWHFYIILHFSIVFHNSSLCHFTSHYDRMLLSLKYTYIYFSNIYTYIFFSQIIFHHRLGNIFWISISTCSLMRSLFFSFCLTERAPLSSLDFVDFLHILKFSGQLFSRMSLCLIFFHD